MAKKDLKEFPRKTSIDDGDFLVGVDKSGKGYSTSVNHLVPKGAIIMWSGVTPPDGWALHEPLRGRFVVGYDPTDADYNAIGKAGGKKEHALTNTEMPRHRHDVVYWGNNDTNSGNARWRVNGITGGSTPSGSPAMENRTGQTQFIGGSGNSQSAASGVAHENRPPYYVLAYIIKVV